MQAARRSSPDEVLARYSAAGVAIAVRGSPRYPPPLLGFERSPAVVFTTGGRAAPALDASWSPAVGVVGTRSATHYGLEIAAEIGSGLSAAGVSVVSGLALGIDSAAHEGALTRLADGAFPVAVVGCGIDVVYPARTARLRERVAESGLVVSDAPLGAPPEPWRFPMRNRLLVALCVAVVVVESHRAGGSLLTAGLALELGVDLLAVPGSVKSPASSGTNDLIADGALVARDVDDVLVAVGLAAADPVRPARAVCADGRRRPGEVPAPPRVAPAGAPADDELTEAERSVLAAVEDVPTSVERILERVGAPLGPVSLALERLADLELVRRLDNAVVRRR
jgi:DNA processing protein